MSDARLVIMFVDICDSTRLFADYGDAQALAMTSACIQKLKITITEYTGTVIQTFGDGILCTFNAADQAFKAAQAFPASLADQKLSIHVGCHFGPVIKKDDSIYGDAVNLASRLADLADNDEMIWSEDALSQLSPHFHHQLRALGSVSVKGKAKPMNAYLMVASSAQDATITDLRTNPALAINQHSLLELNYRDRPILLSELSADFTLGRQAGCDLVVQNNYASRRHATIECKRGKFFLLDHSTNGCYVTDEKEQLIVLKRDFIQLSGSGHISLGVDPQRNQNHLVYYRVFGSLGG